MHAMLVVITVIYICTYTPVHVCMYAGKRTHHPFVQAVPT